jgi:hypothetical protein
LGSHLVTPRRDYPHHGIYAGDCKVVHYSGLAQGMRRGPVEEVPLARFARGTVISLRLIPESEEPADSSQELAAIVHGL